jgi:RNA polymerase sigma-70 factor (ECF subfamily)
MEHVAGGELATVAQPREKTADLEDFSTLVANHRPAVFRFLLVSLRDQDAAETLTQECFLKAYKARNSFRGESKVSTWLMHIALNLVRDHARNRRIQFWKRTRESGAGYENLIEFVPSRETSQESALLAREQVRAVWAVAETLSERQRTVFLLRFVEELDLLEIAKVTGMKEGTVKAHLFRAIEAIRKRLKGLP